VKSILRIFSLKSSLAASLHRTELTNRELLAMGERA
jgi:hypothetical protein